MFSLEQVEQLRGAGYEVEVQKTPYDTSYAQTRVKLPKNGQIPNIIGWAGPARSGTTSLLFLLAGHKQVSRVFFQPIKTILRTGGPDFNLHGEKTICFKEVFRGCCQQNDHDPIKVLLNAGVPPQNISWIAMLREPLQNYASWTQHIAGCTPEDYAAAQAYTVKIYDYYKKLGLNIIPFAYDLLEKGESIIADILLKKMGVESLGNELEFKSDFIDEKIEYGQAEDPNYFKMSVSPTLARKKFVYTKNKQKLTDVDSSKINKLCRDRYEEFYELSRAQLGV